MDKGVPPSGSGCQPSASAVPASLSGIPNAVAPVCIECANTAVLVSGERIYPHRRDLYERWFYLCQCGAYCGTHKGTTEPLGYPCGPVTRAARSRAHAAFDPLWRGRNAPMRRGEAYQWLARRLGISKDACHIGMMDAAMADATARFSREHAQAMSASGQDPQGLEAKPASAVAESDAP